MPVLSRDRPNTRAIILVAVVSLVEVYSENALELSQVSSSGRHSTSPLTDSATRSVSPNASVPSQLRA